MKKMFLSTLTILGLGLSIATAQINTKQKELITLGGNINKSTMSVPQIVDYPMLIVNDSKIHVAGFEIMVTSEDGSKTAGPFMSQTGKFVPEMVSALEGFKNIKSVLKIQHIILIKEGKPFKEESLEFNINQ